jgi:2-polyprenyl-3-methyl-5-hydroxy-6-metoxy-1,4-benzoquinol methylase
MNFKTRSYEPEIMDDLEMEGEELASTLRQIAMVNKYLGGTEVVLAGVKKLLKGKSVDRPIKIIDLGCGGGEILRKIADWGAKKGIELELMGVDANAFIVDYAADLSQDYSNIRYRQINIFSPEFEDLEYDIALCSLFLHHFTDQEIVELMKKMRKSAKIGLLINDLHRSKLAHTLFDLVTRILGASHMVRYDGKLSIRRAFRRKDLEEYMQKAQIQNYDVKWKWAFRYQLIAESD